MIDEVMELINISGSEADIWSNLDCVSKEVYCCRYDDFTPSLHGKTVYIMVSEGEAVVILKDDYDEKKYDELADEERFGDDVPLYFTDVGHRVSPVYELNVAANALLESCMLAEKKAPRILCVLLTKSYIINYDDMLDTWDTLNTIVLHDLTDLGHELIGNNDKNLPGADIMDTYLKMNKEGKLTFTLDTENMPQVNDFYRKRSTFFKSKLDNMIVGDGENKNIDVKDDDDYEPASLIGENDSDLIEGNILSQDGNVQMKRKLPSVQVLKPLKGAKKVLDGLIGLDNIKKHLEELTCLAKYNVRLKEYYPNAITHEINLHGIFYGSVGVGKTTVGRIYGGLLHDCGVLSKGHVVLANRGTFIGTHWGDEEINVRLTVKMAQGGVLMIDEAYMLVSENKADPGQLVLPQLLEILADESNRDIAVLLCGYEKPIMHLLSTNPGLNSRFVNRYKFSDFTLNELFEISRCRVKKYDYEFTAEAWRRYKTVLSECFKKRNVTTWSNARFVANFLEQIYLRHAQRCIKSNVTGKDLLKIKSIDIPLSVAAQEKELRIGF